MPSKIVLDKTTLDWVKNIIKNQDVDSELSEQGKKTVIEIIKANEDYALHVGYVSICDNLVPAPVKCGDCTFLDQDGFCKIHKDYPPHHVYYCASGIKTILPDGERKDGDSHA